MGADHFTGEVVVAKGWFQKLIILLLVEFSTKGGGGSAIPPELVRFLKNVPNGLIHPEMKRKFFPHYRPPPSLPSPGDRI